MHSFRHAEAVDFDRATRGHRLTDGLGQYHADSLAAAKSADTRQGGIDKAIALFRAGKRR
jgi:hypothetical protein